MALVLKDRVKETSTTTGTGTLTLLGAEVGYQAFSVIGSGNSCYYTIQNTAVGFEVEWEVGIGTYISPNQLNRDTVLSSSNSGSLVVFSAGTKTVFLTYPAERSVALNATTAGLNTNEIPFADTDGYIDSDTALQYGASSGELKAPFLYSSDGITVYSTFVSRSYTIPANSVGVSYGPIAVGSGVSVTVSSGSRWVTNLQV